MSRQKQTPPSTAVTTEIEAIVLRGARQNNLKNLSLDIPVNRLVVITGVSGSGKSTLAFDTIYAEGQRRYIETFSAYARQFLDRMDKPAVDNITGIPPAIAIDQSNPVRTSRSTVGTMTELNDYFKLLFARLSHLYCPDCHTRVKQDTAESIIDDLAARLPEESRLHICMPIVIPENFDEKEVRQWLEQQGYTRIQHQEGATLHVVQDRLKLRQSNFSRLREALEHAMDHGGGRVIVYSDPDGAQADTHLFSRQLHCASCDQHFRSPTPGMFSFNSPVGACESCRGFGRIIDVDYDLVIPDQNKSLAEGAIKVFQSKSYLECQMDLEKYARRKKIPLNKPWSALSDSQKAWVIDGEGGWRDNVWYGLKRFFQWLESRAYKMHIRVLLSRYRAYRVCDTCHGARLKDESLCWYLHRHYTPAASIADKSQAATERDALNIRELMTLPISDSSRFIESIKSHPELDAATELLVNEISSRLSYLLDVGLGYLTLDRQSRTLSGGEVQRINLTTALGTSLVNTLFVLDEPSIGLHSRDLNRMISILHRLRDAGNSLIVVEHDPDIIMAADLVIDIGSGPGKEGGSIQFMGTPKQLLRSRQSLTAAYLRNERQVAAPGQVASAEKPNFLSVRGASAHNLTAVDADIPLNQLVCFSGVSGSGKSTLMRDIIYRGLCRHFGEPTESPGTYQSMTGMEQLDGVVYVDQNPIGKTTRSIPATYVGAFDAIRKRFVNHPLAKERGYKPGIFSFNSGNGRCPVCSGNGFEHVEMQFLSDVYLECGECKGRRYRREILEITLVDPAAPGHALSIADVLELTVTEAQAFFADDKEVQRCLRPLSDVGLGYLQLGQAVPTLSGGESQRLKLAAHLAEVARTQNKSSRKADASKHLLFLFDEPTTGLHFQDIHVLVNALRKLLDAGHSLLIIEHNLDVLRAADHLIDLGPEGGSEGGNIVAFGSPSQIQKGDGHTAKALRDYEQALVEQKKLAEGADNQRKPVKSLRSRQVISIHKAREHNLKQIDVTIPRNKFTVISGVSGSGKSTLAFDIVFAEGQRRYLESLNAYARQFVQPAARPNVDAIHGIPPTVAIEQRTSRGGRKSTVATLTEIYHFLRLLFVKLGTQYCPDCDEAIQPQSPERILQRLTQEYPGQSLTFLAPVVVGRKGIYKELAAWASQQGYPHMRADGRVVESADWPVLDRYKEHDIEVVIDQLTLSKSNEQALSRLIDKTLAVGNGMLMVMQVDGKTELFSTQRACPGCGSSFDELDPRLFSFNSRHGWCHSCFGTGIKNEEFDETLSGEESHFLNEETGHEEQCKKCQGKRLNPTALAVRLGKSNITDMTALSVADAEHAILSLPLDDHGTRIARDVIPELQSRLQFLQKVGLGYLTLDRSAPTLSGGEAQRIRLASQLGSQLQGVCYILDEPTIGLHARDNERLVKTLRELQQQGNTVIVVEHDDATITEADHVIDVGPGAGKNGGEILVSGTVKQVMRSKASLTGQYLANPVRHPLADLRDITSRKQFENEALIVHQAQLHNLKIKEVKIPLRKLVAVTGVSGSGKSSLIRGIVYPGLKAAIADANGRKRRSSLPWVGCKSITGWDDIQSILQVDQTPIGKTPRSCPASYVGIWDNIRKLFADTVDARLRGYKPGRFSFNVAGGRCEDCSGNGMQRIEMNFLPDVRIPCETCQGWRFNAETLTVRYKEKHIGEVLAMDVDTAVTFFAAIPNIHHPLSLLQDIGLGYLTLGQQSPTLSGGEAQRIKLVSELAKAKPHVALKSNKPPHKLYVLDEPTVGLHMADVEKLIRVLHRLVDAGNSVLVIEHNLDLIAEADWVMDLGPEGGQAGGKLVCQGNPLQVLRSKKSLTAQFLRPMLT
ncbi:UvrABC system protein A [Pseudohongiella nitratireducens]|uniref:UvrABC system protein A n=1 Tax=Pseudohongiella nitratireducens TaxID=1768907 RepID=A0A917GV45_9GAMM|nr:excinuclease ABC subunit UvrA [Pseudohongiella nitratireducens]GGG57586.1 UvrABC system protein A [Pseudohongiella nitratireducens]